MPLVTRPLTGHPSWPLVALAGVPKGGKTLGIVAASASPHIGRTFLVFLGERIPEEYGALEGQRVEVAEHDGTYRDLLRVLEEIVAVPPVVVDGVTRPNLIGFDGASGLYDLLTSMSQSIMEERNAAKRRRTPGAPGEVKLTPDLWNLVADRWTHVMDVLKAHRGPVVITARLDNVAVFDESGNITRDKRWKVQAHKSFEYDVDAIIELREPAKPGKPAPATLRGVRSLRFRPDDNSETEATFDSGLALTDLWAGLGVTDGAGETVRSYVSAVVDHVDDVAPQQAAAQERQQERQQARQERPQRPPAAQQTSAPAPAPQQPAQDLHPSLRAVAVRALECRDVEELSRTYAHAAERTLLDVDVRAALDATDREVLEVPGADVEVPLGNLLHACARFVNRNGCPVRWERLAEAARPDQQTPTARAS